ncbi:MAG: NAD(P)-dependent glycerol-3-phosphate dehydrogenase [Candidatus Omnitrophica bacterium]|nr:NAD(P)-dependent glycerol-3-phosphate dehydrogenase [Candidatus Omnitrophota bacterium]
MKISIIGDGGWGTALAVLLANKFSRVTLWGAFPAYLKVLKRKRINEKFLPGIIIPENVDILDDLAHALESAELIVLAIPAQYMRKVTRKIKVKFNKRAEIVSVAKGLEPGSSKRMSEVILEELGKTARVSVLSGPNIAYEVACGIPSAAVCASKNNQSVLNIQNVFMTPTFRIYASNDVIGVELAGALKNIIAIACGISDGLGFGTNTKAALLTRGLSEIMRLGIAMGAQKSTFSGLSGIGDLVTTCMNEKSRNRTLGEQLGKGKKLNNILRSNPMVIEGVGTAKVALKLSKKYGIIMPISLEVYNVLYNVKSPRDALRSLMNRQGKREI